MKTKFAMITWILLMAPTAFAGKLQLCDAQKEMIKLPGLTNVCMSNSSDPQSACICNYTNPGLQNTLAAQPYVPKKIAPVSQVVSN